MNLQEQHQQESIFRLSERAMHLAKFCDALTAARRMCAEFHSPIWASRNRLYASVVVSTPTGLSRQTRELSCGLFPA